jgi:hypothetical protein
MDDAHLIDCVLLAAPDPRQDETYGQVMLPLLEVNIARALAGDQQAVVAYVGAWRSARARLLTQVIKDCPSVRLPPLAEEALDWEALQAPFSSWQSVVDNTQSGLALDLIARLRNVLAGTAAPLRLSDQAMKRAATPEVDPEVVRRFYRMVVAALQGRGTMAAQIVDAFGISTAELGRLFGVSRQAADQWLGGDVPADRRGKASTVLAIADLLSHRLKPGKLPGVARRPAGAYGGRTMLEMIAAGEHEELLESVRASFDFAKTA